MLLPFVHSDVSAFIINLTVIKILPILLEPAGGRCEAIDGVKSMSWFTDRNGTSYQTPDAKPVASSGVPVTISDNKGGTITGHIVDGLAVPDKK